MNEFNIHNLFILEKKKFISISNENFSIFNLIFNI